MLPVSNGGDPYWVKSSRSTGNGQCVEVSAARDGIALRDSKDPGGPVLKFRAATWRDFVHSVRTGQFDRPA